MNEQIGKLRFEDTRTLIIKFSEDKQIKCLSLPRMYWTPGYPSMVVKVTAKNLRTLFSK